MPVPFRREGPSRVAVEGAFAEHLRVLRAMLQPEFERLVVASPVRAADGPVPPGMDVIDERRDGIRHVALHPAGLGAAAFWLRHLPRVLATLRREVGRAGLVHAGTSHDLWRPIEFLSLALARHARVLSLCVVDIDQRNQARMQHATGRWSRKSLLLCRWVYDPLRSLQLRLAVRWCALVLLKGRRLVADYGAGRPHVHYFVDAAFSEADLVPAAELDAKLAAAATPGRALELVSFGRLTAYKGVDRCLRAVALAAPRAARPLHLTVIGSGEEEPALRALARELDLGERVSFRGPLPFGPELYAALRRADLALATPLSEDTPRAALDALASGVPLLAFDTEYYADLAESGAVDLVPWPDVGRLADRLVAHAADPAALAPRARAALAFARENTQQAWLDRRVAWTRALFAAGAPSASPSGAPS